MLVGREFDFRPSLTKTLQIGTGAFSPGAEELQGTERPPFFFEINESWYYMLNLAALHWRQKPEE